MSKYISVIIPAYNCEKYIKRCVESIENQTYDNVEIIVVNDGSKDNTLKICNELSEKYSNIKIVDKENGGVSSARNEGIKVSIGEYIMFIDADDTLEKTALEKLLSNLNNNNYDIVLGNFDTIKQDETIVNDSVKFNSNNIEVFDYITINYLWAPWGKLIKREFVDKYFDENVHIGEDALFWFDNNKSCSYIYDNNVCYHHYENLESAMHNKVLNKRDLSCFLPFEKIINETNGQTQIIYMMQYINNYYKYTIYSKDEQNLLENLKDKLFKNVKLYYSKLIKSDYLTFKEKLKFCIKIRFTWIYKLLNKFN